MLFPGQAAQRLWWGKLCSELGESLGPGPPAICCPHMQVQLAGPSMDRMYPAGSASTGVLCAKPSTEASLKSPGQSSDRAGVIHCIF